MTDDPEDDVGTGEDEIERPATWENVVMGKTKEAIGTVIGDDDLVAEGEQQEEVAHEVREEYREEKHSD